VGPGNCTSGHFALIEILINTSMPIILPEKEPNVDIINLELNIADKHNPLDSQNKDIEIINLESNVSYKPNPLNLEKTWMQQKSIESSMCKPNSIYILYLQIAQHTINKSLHK
jgi:hypothetical protein